MRGTEKTIYVYADWKGGTPVPVGRLYAQESRGKEVFSFEYADTWLDHPPMALDPELALYRGRQYMPLDRTQFGVFSDSSPDRWGRLLMQRREAIRAKNAGEKPRKLTESDYLLGVYDEARMGALRYKTEETGEFVSVDRKLAAPPWATLRELENAASRFENEDAEEEKWLAQLIAPGSSLGGARPKATVQGPDGTLWIAKFPSKHDQWDTGAWEMVAHNLAARCGICVPEARLEKFSASGSTYLVKRFDRNGAARIHFSSAMTLLGRADGSSGKDGSSYLDIASFLRQNGENPSEDLRELWKRIVFSIAVSNTDDHLRNHGFLFGEKGWRLSPMYDVNPDIYGHELSLNIDEYDPSLSFETAVHAALYFGIPHGQAESMKKEIAATVERYWRVEAENCGIPRSGIKKMEPAFDMTLKNT